MTETREEVQARWWAAWRDQDFSWEGLAAKPVGNSGEEVDGGLHGERNLQEYWRRDPATGTVRDDTALLIAGELIRAPDSALWHAVHVPLAWPDGTPAKARWDSAVQGRLAALVAARLAAAEETDVDAWCNATAADGRAQLQGAVLLRAPTPPGEAVPPLVADWADIPRWDARDAAIGAGIRFDNANFFATRFDNAIFSGDASFVSATFSGHAIFDSATFSGYARFDSATFSGHAIFDSATFSGYASFYSATFGKRMSFATARFQGLAFFTAIKAWPQQAEDWHRVFLSTEFARPVSFEGSGLHALAAFDGIRIGLEATLLLDDVSDRQATSVFRHELRAAVAQGGRDAKLAEGLQGRIQKLGCLLGLRIILPLRRADRQRLHNAQDIRLKELERGCRALVVEMEKLRDRTRAQLFYRFEIEARRRQHETPRWEKITSGLYDFFGDYGASIARPLAALLVSIPLAAPLYGGFLAWQRPALCTERLQPACENLANDQRGTVWPLAWGSLGFSASRALPFGAWEVKAEDAAQNNPVRMLLLGEADTWQHVLIRALGTLHSVFALAMAFLSGVAIRRRFQLD